MYLIFSAIQDSIHYMSFATCGMYMYMQVIYVVKPAVDFFLERKPNFTSFSRLPSSPSTLSLGPQTCPSPFSAPPSSSAPPSHPSRHPLSSHPSPPSSSSPPSCCLNLPSPLFRFTEWLMRGN